MNYQEKLKTLREKNSELFKIKSEIIDISSDIFEDFYKHIFDKYPTLESFGWSQYTPYFNDGDTCIFSANTDYLNINGEYVDESNWSQKTKVIDWGNWNKDTRKYEGRVEEDNDDYDPILSEASNEIVDFLGQFDNDFYLSKFGDHAEITVTKDGVDISDYDHD
jgi:hypothetical protein